MAISDSMQFLAAAKSELDGILQIGNPALRVFVKPRIRTIVEMEMVLMKDINIEAKV